MSGGVGVHVDLLVLFTCYDHMVELLNTYIRVEKNHVIIYKSIYVIIVNLVYQDN